MCTIDDVLDDTSSACMLSYGTVAQIISICATSSTTVSTHLQPSMPVRRFSESSASSSQPCNTPATPELTSMWKGQLPTACVTFPLTVLVYTVDMPSVIAYKESDKARATCELSSILPVCCQRYWKGDLTTFSLHRTICP